MPTCCSWVARCASVGAASLVSTGGPSPWRCCVKWRRLVDIHGQSEHLSLLRVREHTNLLDRYAELEPLRAQVADVAKQVRAVRRELADLVHSEQELAHRADLLQFQIGEIGAAALQPNEEGELLEERLAAGQRRAAGCAGGGGTPSARGREGEAIAGWTCWARPCVPWKGWPGWTRAGTSAACRREHQLPGGGTGHSLRDYQEQIEYNPAGCRRLRNDWLCCAG